MIKSRIHSVLFLAACFCAITGARPLEAQQPNPPTNVIASAQMNAVQITWDAVPNAADYLIYRYEVPRGTFVAESTLVANTPIKTVKELSFTDTTAAPGTIYMYVVQSQNASGASTLQGNSNYSCGRPVASGDNGTYPTVRPLVYMAAHGTDGVSVITQSTNSSAFYQDPTTKEVSESTTATSANPNGALPLINTTNPDAMAHRADWSTVASCLDGIWGNYAKVSLDDETKLYQAINTKNTIVEQDVSANNPLLSPTSPALKLSGVNLNRKGMAIYASDPSLIGETGIPNTTLSNLQSTYTAANVEPTPYENIYTGFNLNAWVDPYSQMSGISPGTPGVYTYPNATSVYMNANGSMQECDNGPDGGVPGAKDTCNGPLAQGFLNNLIQTHVQGGNFILFFAIGAGSGVGPNLTNAPTTGALSQLQTLFNAVSTAPCSGVYDAANSGEGQKRPYYLCDQNNDPGLWRRGDIVLVINYQGWYPSTPEFSADTTFEDSVTGLLSWLITR